MTKTAEFLLTVLDLMAEGNAAALPGRRAVIICPQTRRRVRFDLELLAASFDRARQAPRSPGEEFEPIDFLKGILREIDPLSNDLGDAIATFKPAEACEPFLGELVVEGADGLGQVDQRSLYAAFAILAIGMPITIQPHSQGAGMIVASPGYEVTAADLERLQAIQGTPVDLSTMPGGLL